MTNPKGRDPGVHLPGSFHLKHEEQSTESACGLTAYQVAPTPPGMGTQEEGSK